MIRILIDYINFLMRRKKYWLVPLFLVLMLFGLLMYYTAGTVVAPFIYTLF